MNAKRKIIKWLREGGVEGMVRWANSQDKSMRAAYKKLVNIFGNNLTNKGKEGWIKKLMYNSGYTDSLEFVEKDGETKVPVTLTGNDSAVCFYPNNVSIRSYIHEGVHFLAWHGPENERLIKKGKDKPLAYILDIYFTLRQNPEKLEELLYGMSLEQVERLATENPFAYNYEGHLREEQGEAMISAVTAYSISEEQGEEEGINYILRLMKQAEKAGQEQEG